MKKIEMEFNNLLGELTDNQFWDYVRGWFNEDLILDIMKNWDLDTKGRIIKEMKGEKWKQKKSITSYKPQNKKHQK